MDLQKVERFFNVVLLVAPTKRLLINGANEQRNMRLDVVQDKETTITCTSEGATSLAVLRWYRSKSVLLL